VLSFGTAEECILFGGSQVTHVVNIFFPSCARVEIVGDDTFELLFEDGFAESEFFSAVLEAKFIFSYKLGKGVVL
jgi:hypothetical protein